MGRGRGADSPASSEGRGGPGFRGVVRGGGGPGGQDRGRASFGGGPRGAPRGRGSSPASVIFAANTPARPDDRLAGADRLVATFRQLAIKVRSLACLQLSSDNDHRLNYLFGRAMVLLVAA